MPLGIRQALEVKKYFDYIYISISERYSDTAELIIDFSYKRMKGLKEMNFCEDKIYFIFSF